MPDHNDGPTPIAGGFCTDCGLAVDSFEGLNRCPNCGSTSIPCSYDNQVTISVNWQELRILVMWAEKFAHANLGGAGLIYSIAGRIEQQHEARAIIMPLTLAGEIGQIQDMYGRENVETNVPGVE